MPTAVALLVLSSALMAAFLVAGLPLTVKKGDAWPVVNDRDMVEVPAVGHSVGRGEALLVKPKAQLEPQKLTLKADKSSAAANNTAAASSTTSAAPASKGDKKLDDVGATTEFSPLGPSGPMKVNSGALLRSFYVFMGLGFIVIMYLVARSVRLKQKVTRVHKYGIIANREDMEMAPLDADEDEDDVVFELPNNA